MGDLPGSACSRSPADLSELQREELNAGSEIQAGMLDRYPPLKQRPPQSEHNGLSKAKVFPFLFIEYESL